MKTAAVILAGGKSTRYGRCKGLEIVDGRPLIGCLVDEVRASGIPEVYISTDDPDPFQFLGLPMVPDRFPGGGPLAGIHSALLESGADMLLVLPCDMPGITRKEIAVLIEAALKNQSKAVFAATESCQYPLCSIVRRNILDDLTATLTENKNAALRFFKSIDHGTVFFEDERPFVNINTPDDLAAWEDANARG
jgi:molybdopterin-guanine dinucleotide biosynthesis protein A